MSLYYKFITEEEKGRVIDYYRSYISKETIIQKITFLKQIRKALIVDTKDVVVDESFLDSLATLMVDFCGCAKKMTLSFQHDERPHWFKTIFEWTKKQIKRETSKLEITNIIFDIVILQVVLITLQSLVMDGMNPPVLSSNSLIVPNMRLSRKWLEKMRDFMV